MTTPFRRCCAFAVMALILAFAPSCGRKTAPLTPPSPRPEIILNVRVVARDGVAFLSWPVPTRNIEGKEMNPAHILGFRIYRAELTRGRKKARYRQVAEIQMNNPAPAEIRGGRVVWSDTNLRYGQTYGYRIRTISSKGGLSAPSEQVRVVPLLSLAPPKRLEAEAGDSVVTLTWTPVVTRSDGSDYTGFVGYNVYRGNEQGRQSEAPLNKEPVRTTTYKDTAVLNGRTYYYFVRAVDSPAQPWKESLDSPEASTEPRDMTPPARPKGLTVVPGVGRIFLTWNENKEQDLAGYYVYRSRKPGRDYKRLTEKPIIRSTYSDEKVKPGVVYYYAVAAVDRTGNESAPSKEEKAFAEMRRPSK